MDTVVVAVVPAALVAVSVYVVAAEVTEGVPEITPEVVSMIMPVGSAGAILIEVTELPSVGVIDEMDDDLVKVKGDPATETVGDA